MMQGKGWRELPVGAVLLDAGSSVAYTTGGWRAFRPVLGEAKCTHCFQCWLFCPDSSILVDVEREEMTGFDLKHCKGCGICAAVCPVNAKVARGLGRELARNDTRLCIAMVEEASCTEADHEEI